VACHSGAYIKAVVSQQTMNPQLAPGEDQRVPGQDERSRCQEGFPLVQLLVNKGK
jgi:hypothetical protein